LPCGGFLGPFCLTAHPAHAAHAKTHMPAQLHAHACTCPHMPKKVILVEVAACTCLRLLPHMPHSPPRTCPHSRTAHAAHAFGPTWAKCIPMGFLWVGLVGTRTTKIGARGPKWSPRGKKQRRRHPKWSPRAPKWRPGDPKWRPWGWPGGGFWLFWALMACAWHVRASNFSPLTAGASWVCLGGSASG
jgi:hypothetical protein